MPKPTKVTAEGWGKNKLNILGLNLLQLVVIRKDLIENQRGLLRKH
jgi:hypothetical protein